MLNRRTAPPALKVHIASTDSSPRASWTLDGANAGDSSLSDMSMDYSPLKPLTVAIPQKVGAQGPFYPRRPNLSEILANTAEPPWTLSAFMAYLSQNHCLETLEFTMDASRYRKHYNKMIGRTPGTPISPESDECNYVRMLWQRLLEAYIAPNGPREVNLPSDVRDSLLTASNPYVPPHPSTLEPAVTHIYKLMEESVLIPFLSSYPSTHSTPAHDSDENLRSHAQSYDERATRRRERRSSPSHGGEAYSYSPSSTTSPSHRASAPSSFSQFARGFGMNTTGTSQRFSQLSHSLSVSKHNHHNSRASTTSAHAHAHAPSGSSSNTSANTPEYGPLDDSGSVASTASPATTLASTLSDPMTPPTTPPMSEFNNSFGGGGGSPTAMSVGSAPSPRQSRVEAGGNGGGGGTTWKRMSHKLGWKKKSAGALREEGAQGQGQGQGRGQGTEGSWYSG